ncbi:MAG TPA: gamma-glutamyltransferase, partial [Longimicrobiales bacterium]
ADRDKWVSDPRFVRAPVERLASAEYAHERRRLIRLDRALGPGEIGPGTLFDSGQTPDAEASSANSSTCTSTAPPQGEGDTCYFCAVDADGLAVSCIQSIFYAFGSMVVAGESGIVLQDRGTSFSLDPRAANRLEPGKRPLHTLIPAMLVREGKPWLVFGSMGGEGQPQAQAALVTRMVDFEYSPRAAVEAPRWLYGRSWGEASRALSLESRFPEATARELARRGHDVRVLGPWEEAMGHAQAILRREDGSLEGAADPRGDGAALTG